jgi:hypothetical protein
MALLSYNTNPPSLIVGTVPAGTPMRGRSVSTMAIDEVVDEVVAATGCTGVQLFEFGSSSTASHDIDLSELVCQTLHHARPHHSARWLADRVRIQNKR